MGLETLPALAIVLVLALAPAAVLARDARRAAAPRTEASRALRHATTPAAVAAAGLLVGLVAVPSLVMGVPSDVGAVPGRLLAGLPLIATLTFLAVHAVGELTYPRPSGDMRTAGLTARGVAEVAPRHLLRITHGWAVLLGLALLLGTATATGPRHLDRVVEGWVARGAPYPGTWYAVPVAAATLLVVLATHVVLHLVATRPAIAGVDAAWDHALRRRTAARVLRGVQLALAGTLALMVLMAAFAVSSASSAMPALGSSSASLPWSAAAWALRAGALGVCLAGAVLATCRGTAPLPPTARLEAAPA